MSASPFCSLFVITVMLLFFVTVTEVEGAWTRTCTVEQMSSQRSGNVCGSRIPAMLSLVCGTMGTFNQYGCKGKRGKTFIINKVMEEREVRLLLSIRL